MVCTCNDKTFDGVWFHKAFSRIIKTDAYCVSFYTIAFEKR